MFWELSPRTELTTQDGETVTGTFEDVIDELNPATWQTLTWTIGGLVSDEEMRLRFRRKSDLLYEAGVDLEVQSADPGTVASAMSRLGELIELGRPKWAWVHRTFSPYAIFLVAVTAPLLASATMLVRLWLPSLHGISRSLLIAGIVIVLSLGLSLTTLSPQILRRLLPPCEIRLRPPAAVNRQQVHRSARRLVAYTDSGSGRVVRRPPEVTKHDRRAVVCEPAALRCLSPWPLGPRLP